MNRLIGATFAIFSVCILAACGESAVAPSQATGAAYRDAGPYTAGVTTVSLGDREMEIWYPVDPGDEGDRERDAYYIRDWLPDAIDALLPAEANPPFITDAYRDAPASTQGPFPLVLFAHGSASYRTQSTFLTTHLASWGFVVVSPDYLERGLAASLVGPPEETIEDIVLSRLAVERAATENARPGGPLEGRIAADRVAVTGHSAGGGSAFRYASEPTAVTYIPLSAGAWRGSEQGFPDVPSMWITGDIDGIADVAGVENAFAAATPPTRLVVLENAGHLAPSDICEIGAEGGGVVQIALDAGLPVPERLQVLGTDGCQPEALDAEAGWAVIQHFVTAQMRHAFGIDDEPVGLSAEVVEEFPDAPFRYQER